ncbi:BMP family ABC transporter substrate-binding protein [Streptomyces mirabilis]|uniref:BMP family ABC transporter substrate-binding protein n=1 Tax=Streptomyces mirabilis TaxID=68239 RepID=UPI0022585272|nr:BMP family ABC transporter substrate-binding protein [Streptomyces mirabilis]MCX4609676.1 BMP family ABC transporter substrate-binding protein [Streptomyces mirabilis]
MQWQWSSRWLRLSWSASLGAIRKRPIAFGAGLAVVVAAGVTGVLLRPSGDGPELPTARVYRDVDACLLTDSRGVVPGVPAAAVWAGMQDASVATRARASFLSATGPDTQANDVPYVNSLVQEHCSVVVAVGPMPVRAVRAVAPRQKGVLFVVVGDGPGSANVSVVSKGGSAEVREHVRGLVASLARAS